MTQKIIYEDTYGVLNIEIVNFNLLSAQLTDIDDTDPPTNNVKAAEPALPRQVARTIQKLPFSLSYTLQQAQLISTLDSVDVNVLRFASMKKVSPDLPRGIVPGKFIKHTEVLAEAVYQDELIGGNFTAHVIKFKENHPYGSNIAEYFAKTIKDTREYSFEEMLPVTINAGTTLEGFAVNIEPRKGRIRRYLVLSEPSDSLYLYFLQSAKTKEKQMEGFASNLNRERGLESYTDFNQALYTLPDSLDGNNALIHFQLKQVTGLRGRYAGMQEGFNRSKAVFYHREKGVWEYHIQRLQDEKSAAFVFEKLYRPSRSKDSIRVWQNPGWLVSARRRHRNTKKWANLADELQFHKGGNIIVLTNKKRAWLEKQDMLDFAHSLRLEPILQKAPEGLFW